MKPKLLLTLSSLFLVASLAGCGAEPAKTTLPSTEESTESSLPSNPSTESEPSTPSAESEPSTPSADTSDPSESSEEPKTALDLFMENLAGGNMTVVDEGWLTISVYGDDAIYYQYASSGEEFGYVLYEGERIFEFTLGEDGVVLTDEIIDEKFEGGTLLNYFPNPYILSELDNVWVEGEDNVFTTDDETVKILACVLGSYGTTAASFVEEVTLTIAEDGSEGVLGAIIDNGSKQYVISLTIGEFGTTQNDAVDAYLDDPWEYVAPEDPGYMDLLLENLAGKNFTFSTVSDEDEWETMYVIGDNALFNNYSEAAEGYGAKDNGVLIFENNVYSFGIEEDAVADLTFVEELDPDYPSVLDYVYSAFDFTFVEWEYVGDGTYFSDSALACTIMAKTGGYGSHADYINGVYVTVAEDGSEATFVTECAYFDIELTVGDFGTTAVQAISDYFDNPWVPTALTDWTDDTKAIFQEAFGEVIPFYEGFTSKMVETDYLDIYGVYFVQDTGLLPADCFAYGEILLENGYILDQEESEFDEETGATALLFRKTRGDGKQIIVQVEYDVEAERFQLIIQLYVPPVSYEGYDALNTVILNNGIFPGLPASENATFVGTDWAASASDDWITYSIYLEVSITFETQADLDTYQTLYIDLLEQNGFVFDETYKDWENENFDYAAFETVEDEDSFTLVITLVAYEL